MRFLARIRSQAGRPRLHEWAFPSDPLPDEGAQPPFPVAFEIAQSALRYTGAWGDAALRPKLEAQLVRKDPGEDLTMEGIVARPLAMRGMAVRALGFGAAQGLSELADAGAVAPLDASVSDPLQNEEVRLEACVALAWCTPRERLMTLVEDLSKRTAARDPLEAFRASCLLAALSLRAAPESAGPAAGLLARGGPSLLVTSAAVLATAGLGEGEAAEVVLSLMGEHGARYYLDRVVR
jgi:hypothetical protein